MSAADDSYDVDIPYQMHISHSCGDAFIVCVRLCFFFFFFDISPHECSVVVIVCLWFSQEIIADSIFFNLELSQFSRDNIFSAYNLCALQFS